jgi:hypothetical protein
MKFPIVILYEKLFGKRESHENRLSDNHTSLNGVNKFTHVMSIFAHRFGVKFDKQDLN